MSCQRPTAYCMYFPLVKHLHTVKCIPLLDLSNLLTPKSKLITKSKNTIKKTRNIEQCSWKNTRHLMTHCLIFPTFTTVVWDMKSVTW